MPVTTSRRFVNLFPVPLIVSSPLRRNANRRLPVAVSCSLSPVRCVAITLSLLHDPLNSAIIACPRPRAGHIGSGVRNAINCAGANVEDEIDACVLMAGRN